MLVVIPITEDKLLYWFKITIWSNDHYDFRMDITMTKFVGQK